MEQHTTGRAGRIERIIREHLAPVELRIHDDSARHAHHVHVRDNGVQAGESHYNVLIVSPTFAGVNRVERSRQVHALLADEFAGGMHALSLVLRTPEEQARVAAA